MKMEDQALEHVMRVQTQMLEHITRLQQDQNAREIQDGVLNNFSTPGEAMDTTPENPPPGTNPEALASPTAAPSFNTGEQAVSNPTMYSSYAAPYVGGDRQFLAADEGFRGFIGGTIAEMRDFDATRHSVEATEQFFSEQSRGIQEQAVNVLGGALGGATTAGSLFLPGLVPSLVAGGAAAVGVGGVANALTEETSLALDYQEMLQDNSYQFINAFESTSDMGGIGLGLEDRQEMSRFLRELAPEKLLEDEEVSGILEGASNQNLLKTVSDVESFKRKFSDIVDAVKTITVTMNQTVEEATAFMGELERRGIATQDMPFLAAQAKVTSSVLGVSAEEGASRMLQLTDSVVTGTSMDAGDVMQSGGENMFIAQNIQDWAKENDETLYNYIKNSGGAASTAAAFEQTTRGFASSQRGEDMMLGFFGSAFEQDPETGEFAINQGEMQELLSGDVSAQEMQERSRQALSELNAAEVRRLSGMTSTLFNNWAGNDEQALFLRQNREIIMEQAAQSGNELDVGTALVEAGIAQDQEQAAYFNAMIEGATDEGVGRAFTARTFKEEQDANAIANSPGLFRQAGFWWERNVTNRIGNVGQDVSDTIGSTLQDYQRFITGIDDRSMVGGEELADFDTESLQELIGGLETVNENNRSFEEYNEGRIVESDVNPLLAWTDPTSPLIDPAREYDVEAMQEGVETGFTGELSENILDLYMSQAAQGRMSAADLARFQEREDEMSHAEAGRFRMLERQATGEYEGFLGGINYGVDVATQETTELASDVWDRTIGNMLPPPPPAEEGEAGASQDTGRFSNFDEWMDRARSGDLTTEDLAGYRDEDMTELESSRLRMLERQVEGDYEGAIGQAQYAIDRGMQGVTEFAATRENTGRFAEYDDLMEQARTGNLSAEQLQEMESEDMGHLETGRFRMLERQVEGDYEGWLGQAQYAFDRSVQGVNEFVATTWEDTGRRLFGGGDETGDTDTFADFDDLDDIEKKRGQLQEDRTALNDDLMAVFASGDLADVSDEERRELEKLIRAGETGGVSEITSNEEVQELAESFSQLQEQEAGISENMETLSDLTRWTTGVATAPTQLSDLLHASGVYTEAEIDSLLGGLRDEGRSVKEDIKDEKLSVDELIQAGQSGIEGLENVFENLPEADMHELAEYLTSKDQNMRVEELYLEGTESIDTDKLQDYVMNDIIKPQHVSTNETMDEEDVEAGDVSEATGEHQEAMFDFLNTMTSEVQMLRDAAAGRPITQPSYSTLSSR